MFSHTDRIYNAFLWYVFLNAPEGCFPQMMWTCTDNICCASRCVFSCVFLSVLSEMNETYTASNLSVLLTMCHYVHHQITHWQRYIVTQTTTVMRLLLHCLLFFVSLLTYSQLASMNRWELAFWSYPLDERWSLSLLAIFPLWIFICLCSLLLQLAM